MKVTTKSLEYTIHAKILVPAGQWEGRTVMTSWISSANMGLPRL